jgi:hypothetical protein
MIINLLNNNLYLFNITPHKIGSVENLTNVRLPSASAA